MLTEYRIFGPPGCGKTTTLARLIAEACQEFGSEAVIAASFTRTAAREIVSRDLPIDDQQIGTLHALCYRALDRPKLIGRKQLETWNQDHPSMLFEGGGTPDIDDPYGDPEMSGKQDGDRLLEDLNRLRGMQVPQDAWPMRVLNFAERWQRFKDDTGLLDFTDLIDHTLRSTLPIPFGASVLFLDEVQDFSPLELALARQWGAQAEKVYLAGDDEQCLYTFKGATPDAFLFPELPAEQIIILDQSYRVPRAVHAVACAWSAGIQKRMPKVYRPRDADGIVDQLPITYRYLAPIQDQLDEWLTAGKTVAILASCSFFLDPIKHQLRDWGLPFHNPYRRTRGDWNPLTVRAGAISASDRVLAFRKLKDQGAWWTYADLHAWATVLESDGLMKHGAKMAMRQKAEDAGNTAVAVVDLDHWMPADEAVHAAMAGDLEWFRGRTLKTYDKQIAYACAVMERRGREALTKAPQIILGTIHSVKGGEADIVVLFPDLSPAGYREWSSPGDGEDGIRRCFYVGMTRAREALYWAQPSGMSIGGYL
jgi:superfamily I DNA/RNA helicase